MRLICFVLFLALAILGCSKEDQGPSGDPYDNNPSSFPLFAGHSDALMTFQYDSSVDVTDEEPAISSDLANLASLVLSSPPSGDDATNFGLSDYSGPSLSNWVSQRAKYIVGQDFDPDKNASITSLPNSDPLVSGFLNMGQFAEIQMIMQNLGAGVYISEKKKAIRETLTVADQSINVTTPRVGILQIGPGLFDHESVSSKPMTAPINSLFRIATYVHESRHSDGNSSWAGFPHARCTSGTYEGYAACEDHLNGPYAVEAILYKSFYTSCVNDGCGSDDISSLQLAVSDRESRLTSDAKYSDPTPVSP